MRNFRPLKKPSLQERGGFTITEVIISVGLLTVALLAVIGLFISAIKFQSQSQERGKATELGKQLMERIRSAPNVVPAGPAVWTGGEFAFTMFDPGPPSFPPGPYPYKDGCSFDVYLDTTSRPGMKLVKVVVRWDEGKNLELQTLIHE